jgi:hypothetical protein
MPDPQSPAQIRFSPTGRRCPCCRWPPNATGVTIITAAPPAAPNGWQRTSCNGAPCDPWIGTWVPEEIPCGEFAAYQASHPAIGWELKRWCKAWKIDGLNTGQECQPGEWAVVLAWLGPEFCQLNVYAWWADIDPAASGALAYFGYNAYWLWPVPADHCGITYPIAEFNWQVNPCFTAAIKVVCEE